MVASVNQPMGVALDNLSADLLKIGQIKAPYGILGWVWIYSETEPMTNIFDYQPWIATLKNQQISLKIKRWRTQGKGIVALIEGIDTRNLAESLVGTSLYVQKTALPAAKSDEYYWADLIGLNVFGQPAEDVSTDTALEAETTSALNVALSAKQSNITTDSNEQSSNVLFGVISEMFATGANDVIVVKPCVGSIDDAERLIPWHRSTIVQIDLTAKRMDVNWAADF